MLNNVVRNVPLESSLSLPLCPLNLGHAQATVNMCQGGSHQGHNNALNLNVKHAVSRHAQRLRIHTQFEITARLIPFPDFPHAKLCCRYLLFQLCCHLQPYQQKPFYLFKNLFSLKLGLATFPRLHQDM